jgi:hypothetical protein
VVADAAGGRRPVLDEHGRRLQRGGIILTVLLLAIIALMVIGGETTFLH